MNKFLKFLLGHIPRKMYWIGLEWNDTGKVEWGYITPNYENYLDEEATRLEEDENEYFYVY
jgi:hypothetical protein